MNPEYFRTLGVPILEGRTFADSDRDGAPGVAIISRSLSERYWPGEDPLGRHMKLLNDKEWRTVIGVVADVKWHHLSADRGTGLYIPLLQSQIGEARAIVHTSANSGVLAASLRGVVHSIDEHTPVSNVGNVEQFISDSVAEPRFSMMLLGLFAIITLALGAIGVYGVTTYAVSQRTREIGLRMAMGAQPGEVLRMILRQGLGLALAGGILGIAGAFATTRVLSTMLFGVSATDPLTFASVTLVLMITALAASYLPARRAARVDPMVALRHE